MLQFIVSMASDHTVATYPVMGRVVFILQPGVVCKDAMLFVPSFTPAWMLAFAAGRPSAQYAPSIMSISPPAGHGPFLLTVHQAGHVLHVALDVLQD